MLLGIGPVFGVYFLGESGGSLVEEQGQDAQVPAEPVLDDLDELPLDFGVDLLLLEQDNVVGLLGGLGPTEDRVGRQHSLVLLPRVDHQGHMDVVQCRKLAEFRDDLENVDNYLKN